MDTETSTEIMRATRRALCTHGYANLTMQRIADESSMTTAAIHYHFDTKKELLNAFLDYFIGRFEERLASEASDPRERLATFLDAIFTPAENTDDDFAIPLMELKSQAPYYETYRDRFIRLDERMREVVASAVRDGIEREYFDAADPETVARFVITAINGGHARGVALGENPIETRRIVDDYLEQQLGWTSEVAA